MLGFGASEYIMFLYLLHSKLSITQRRAVLVSVGIGRGTEGPVGDVYII